MRVTVCELANDPRALEAGWDALAAHVQRHRSDLVLLPEMPFHPWLAAHSSADPARWAEAAASHHAWTQRFSELGAAAVVSTRPVVIGGMRYNEGFVWNGPSRTIQPVHRKRYLPDEPGFWEATWYSRGDPAFMPCDIGGARLGFAICTEMWFTRHARDYGKQGVQILACPRATLAPSVDKWIAGGRAAAVVSGAFCLSSNLSGPTVDGPAELGPWGGAGWIVEPEEGEVLGVTSADEPFLTLEIDLNVADEAKSTYPRYVLE